MSSNLGIRSRCNRKDWPPTIEGTAMTSSARANLGRGVHQKVVAEVPSAPAPPGVHGRTAQGPSRRTYGSGMGRGAPGSPIRHRRGRSLVCFSHARYPTEPRPQNPFSDCFKTKVAEDLFPAVGGVGFPSTSSRPTALATRALRRARRRTPWPSSPCRPRSPLPRRRRYAGRRSRGSTS
jgi:hypothetical protein